MWYFIFNYFLTKGKWFWAQAFICCEVDCLRFRFIISVRTYFEKAFYRSKNWCNTCFHSALQMHKVKYKSMKETELLEQASKNFKFFCCAIFHEKDSRIHVNLNAGTACTLTQIWLKHSFTTISNYSLPIFFSVNSVHF